MSKSIEKKSLYPVSSYSKHYKEFFCGYVSALINIGLTFPINKVMFRQMLHGISSKVAFEMLQKEGLRYLYRGCLPPLFQKTVSVSLMFGTYSAYTDAISTYVPMASKSVTLVISAMLAGTTECILTPFERVQTLLQDRQFHSQFRNTFHVFRELRQYGVKEYYRGLSGIFIRNGPSNVMFFGLRSWSNDYLPPAHTGMDVFVKDFITGACVGAVTSTICYPVNVVKTKMQVSYGTPFINFFKACRLTYIERGRSIRRIFYGVHVNYTRACLSWGIINASYGTLKLLFSDNGDTS